LDRALIDAHRSLVANEGETSAWWQAATCGADPFVAVATVWGSKIRCSVLTCDPRMLAGRG
jgi:hypothetical protein